jgi:hypothetical protein
MEWRWSEQETLNLFGISSKAEDFGGERALREEEKRVTGELP